MQKNNIKNELNYNLIYMEFLRWMRSLLRTNSPGNHLECRTLWNHFARRGVSAATHSFCENNLPDVVFGLERLSIDSFRGTWRTSGKHSVVKRRTCLKSRQLKHKSAGHLSGKLFCHRRTLQILCWCLSWTWTFCVDIIFVSNFLLFI